MEKLVMDIFQVVTDAIVQKLEAGVIPWKKSWTLGLPKSLSSGKEYRGINLLILGCQPYSSPYWITLKEANKRGGMIRKGEKSTPVVYWHWRTREEMQRLIDEGKTKDPAPCTPFLSRVFNIEQIDGIEMPKGDEIEINVDKIGRAQNLIDSMPQRPQIQHRIGMSPCYSYSSDTVMLPSLSQFKSANHYYLTLFHEITHATGHASRLNRVGETTSSNKLERYSQEELVAEFGAAFLCGLSGIDNSDAYSH